MYSVRQMDVDDKVSQHVTMDIFAHIYAPESIEKLLQEQRAHEPKQRRLRGVFLLECGSHATIQMNVQPYPRSEVHGAHELMPWVQTGMLVTHDSGLFGGGLWEAIRGKGAHSLSALASTVLPHRAYTLKDGSYLAWLHPSKDAVYPMQKSMLIRVIEYRV